MKIIEKLSDKIQKEIDCAEEYAKCALNYKEARHALLIIQLQTKVAQRR